MRIRAKRKPARAKKTRRKKAALAGREREFGRLGVVLVGSMRMAGVGAAGAAGLGAGTERLVDDRLDGARAAAAFGTAAKAAINLLGVPRQVRRCTDGITNIVVAQDLAGTDNHRRRRVHR